MAKLKYSNDPTNNFTEARKVYNKHEILLHETGIRKKEEFGPLPII